MNTPHARARRKRPALAAFSPLPRTPGTANVLVVLLCLGLGGAPEGHASEDEDGARDIEEVVVTGSRLRRTALDARDLVFGLDLADARHGRTALGEMLARLPASGSPLSTRFNSSGNFGFPADGGGVAAGASQVDLRHLGSKRVLVLVDGLRWVDGASGSGVSGATDLNTLPAGVVERVEVSLDGASAIYGSDAIAGVVNVITAAADGVSGSVYGGAFANGGETYEVEFAAGRQGETTSASLHVSHTDAGSVGSGVHPLSRFPVAGTGNRHGSTFTPQGRVIFQDPNTGRAVNCALNEGVVGIPRYDPDNPCGEGDDYHPWSNADRFNYAPFNLLVTPSRRTGLFARVERGFASGLTAYLRVLDNRRRSVNRAAPEPLWAGPLAESGSVLDKIVISAANPHNPFGFDLGAGAWATRRPLESGPRMFAQDVRTRYVAAGLRGVRTIGQRTFFWDANLVWSRNIAHQTKRGAHNASNMLIALGPPEVCAQTPGCVPLNLLGGQGDGDGTITAPMLEWIRFTQRDFSDQFLRDFTFNVTGDVAWLPAGPLAVAAGFERREQRGKFRPDPVVAAGDTAGLRAQPTAGGHVASEWYGEVEVPLLAGRPWAHKLDVAAALRGSRNDVSGSGSVGKLDLLWRPRPDVLLRAHWGEGFRAPNIGELFGGETLLDAVVADPCSDLGTDSAPGLVARCVAAGVPADGSYAQLGSQIAVRTGGNRELRPETSESRTFAIAWQPQWVGQNLAKPRLELSRYRHELDAAITAFDAQAVLNGCYRDAVDTFCGFVERSALGHIRQFRNSLLNVGVIRTGGWDLEAAFATPASGRGSWQMRWRTTYLAEYTELLEDTEGKLVATRHLAGKTAADRGKPRWKSSLWVNWRRGGWRAAWTARYIHPMTERCSNFLDGSPDSLTSLGLCSLPDEADDKASRNRLGAAVYHDAQAGYAGGGFALAVGANNLFNRDPPVSRSATLNGYDASTYDVPGGRFLYLRLRYGAEGAD